MIDFNAIKLSLYQWISAQSAIPVVWAYQNAPQPEPPYITLYIMNLTPLFQDEVFMADNLGNQRVVGQREFTLNIGYFGQDAVQNLENLTTTLSLPSVQASFRLEGFVYVNRQPLMDLRALEETQYKERASVDIRFRTFNEIVDQPGLIEHAEVIENYYQGQDLVYTNTSLIPPL